MRTGINTLVLITQFLSTLFLPSAVHCLQFINGRGFSLHSPTSTGFESSILPNSELFYIYEQNTDTRVKSSLGILQSNYNITYDLNDREVNDPLRVSPIIHSDGDNVSAHLVTNTVRFTEPNLLVLIHSDGIPKLELCTRVYVQKGEQEIVSNSCFLTPTRPHCLVSVSLPTDWWTNGEVQVFYTLLDTQECKRTTNFIQSNNQIPRDHVYKVGVASLGFNDRDQYKEISEDQHIMISIPEWAARPGSEFTSTIKQHAGSDLTTFIMRIDVGDGLIVKGCQQVKSSLWRIEQSWSAGSLTITATRHSQSETRSKLKFQVEEIMECVMKVSRDIITSEATVDWMIEYESVASGLQFYDGENSIESKNHRVKTEIQIENSHSPAYLVPVIKTSDMVSLSRFTSEVQSQRVWVYTISHSGEVELVNHRNQTRCKSTKESVIKVSRLCDLIYLSAESESPGYVDIHFLHAGLVSDLEIRVWHPDSQLNIRINDRRLNEIRGWKIPEETNMIVDENPRCHLLHQTTRLKVFTRFFLLQHRKPVYMRGGDKLPIYADITNLVLPLFITSNSDIISVHSNVIRGINPGTAYIKVVSPRGVVIAASGDVKVVSSKSQVSNLLVNFISSVEMNVKRSQYEGILQADYTYDNTLTDKHTEGILDMWLEFDDGTRSALTDFHKTNYKLLIDNQSPDILAVFSDSYPVRVRAVGGGRGCLKVSINIVDQCHRKKPKQLASHFICIQSKVEKSAGLLVNDAAYRSDSAPFLPAGGNRQRINLYSKEGKNSPIDTMPVAESASSEENGGGLSPLQTGMFVVMGVLGVVASVFMTNCLIYMYRNRGRPGDNSKQTGDVTEKVANGWIWLNHDVLEDNAVNTFPDRYLPEREFKKRCSRSDSIVSGRSSGSSTATYRGSECSIRITSNPRELVESRFSALNLPSDSEGELEEEEMMRRKRAAIIAVDEEFDEEFGESECDDENLYQSKFDTGIGDQSGSEADLLEEMNDENFDQSDDEGACFNQTAQRYEAEGSDVEPFIISQDEFDNMKESIA